MPKNLVNLIILEGLTSFEEFYTGFKSKKVIDDGNISLRVKPISNIDIVNTKVIPFPEDVRDHVILSGVNNQKRAGMISVEDDLKYLTPGEQEYIKTLKYDIRKEMLSLTEENIMTVFISEKMLNYYYSVGRRLKVIVSSLNGEITDNQNYIKISMGKIRQSLRGSNLIIPLTTEMGGKYLRKHLSDMINQKPFPITYGAVMTKLRGTKKAKDEARIDLLNPDSQITIDNHVFSIVSGNNNHYAIRIR